MEELKQTIIEAVVEGQKRAYELGYCGNKTQPNNGKDPDELLNIEQVCEEFGMGQNKARLMFKDPELPVQRYTKEHKVRRGAMQEYMKTSHDYLSTR